MKNLLIDLPEDLFINNILLSKVLPAKSLLSLRCVCKYLRNLITSTAFINMHLHNHQQLNNQLVLIHSDTPYDIFYSLKFNDGVGGGGDTCRPEEVIMFDYPIKFPKIWGSCNGLLCLSTKAAVDDRVCLWNPSTKEYKDLPPPLPSTEIINIPIRMITKVRKTYGLGYDRFIDDYKIIRCENYNNHISIITEFQVYTLGTNTWRKIGTTANNNQFVLSNGNCLPNEHVFLNGALHWADGSMTETKVGLFDIEKEVFGEIQIPLISIKDYMWITQIQVLRGCLCVFQFDYDDDEKDSCNLWMMMDYGVKESWTKLFTIVQNEVEAPLNIDQFIMQYFKLLRFCENGEILIGTGDILFIYDPTNNRARRVEFGEIGKFYFQSEIYIESLVSLNSGVYIDCELITAFGCMDLD